MALNLENWKSNYYLNNILKLDEVYDEIQSTFNNESTQNEFILFDSSKLTTLSDGYNLIENNSTDSIYVISNILASYQAGEEFYTIIGDVYIGNEAVTELPSMISG